MKKSKTCTTCNLPVRGHEAEGDRPICLQCLASIRPHTTYHEHTYSTIEGMIRQSTDNPIEKTNNEENPTKQNKRNRSKDS
jgi:hypothetical protein